MQLDRDVALKVLPEAFTQDPDRLARFEREAKVLVLLNHPNIGHVYGLEEAEGQKALVLELVEGPTLAGSSINRPSDDEAADVVLEALLDGPVWPHDDRDRGAVGTRLVHRGLTQLRTPFFVGDAVGVELLQELDACVASADGVDHRTGARQDAGSSRGVRESRVRFRPATRDTVAAAGR